MTQLEELVIICSNTDQGLVLPVQLQQLTLEAWNSSDLLSVVVPLKQLQRLRLLQGFSEQQPLLQLAQLPALQHLALQYVATNSAAESAASWVKLPQLQELHIDFDIEAPLPHQIAAILGGAAACSGLTRLLLDVGEEDDADVGDAHPVAVCGKVAGLRTLQELCIRKSSIMLPGDARALTTLSGLTRLVLNDQYSGVNDVTATALACS
ncbi:hypothetical protein COO60DRAFT_1633460 [Scenedesmus sp. NREL 46B-D3]|nr:hypothetical protein COO60DRAFT_1633460 [Scenedesmus sp. NREL 46B-D3]